MRLRACRGTACGIGAGSARSPPGPVTIVVAETVNRPSDYLRAAQGALAAGRIAEAQEALEMAQTRMLDRSVPLGQTNDTQRQSDGDADIPGAAGLGGA